MRARALLPFHLCALSYAQDYIGLEEVGGDNQGPAVGTFLRAADLPPGAPWCAAFVNFCAEMAQVLKNEWSPLEQVKREGYVQDYYAWADRHSRLIPFDQVGPGDLFLIWFHSKGRYAHIGFVLAVHHDSGLYTTVEGNTNETGGREGYMVASRPRKPASKDVFVRWA